MRPEDALRRMKQYEDDQPPGVDSSRLLESAKAEIRRAGRGLPELEFRFDDAVLEAMSDTLTKPDEIAKFAAYTRAVCAGMRERVRGVVEGAAGAPDVVQAAGQMALNQAAVKQAAGVFERGVFADEDVAGEVE